MWCCVLCYPAVLPPPSGAHPQINIKGCRRSQNLRVGRDLNGCPAQPTVGVLTFRVATCLSCSVRGRLLRASVTACQSGCDGADRLPYICTFTRFSLKKIPAVAPQYPPGHPAPLLPRGSSTPSVTAELGPPNSCGEVLSPSTSGCNCIWR